MLGVELLAKVYAPRPGMGCGDGYGHESGAVRDGPWYREGGKRIAVVDDGVRGRPPARAARLTGEG